MSATSPLIGQRLDLLLRTLRGARLRRADRGFLRAAIDEHYRAFRRVLLGEAGRPRRSHGLGRCRHLSRTLRHRALGRCGTHRGTRAAIGGTAPVAVPQRPAIVVAVAEREATIIPVIVIPIVAE